jgi:hypothetical protein
MQREHRRGCEFSDDVRRKVKKRARRECEWPQGCPHPNNGRIDHITPCILGQMLGMDRSTLRSIDNAQMLCEDHDLYKKLLERDFVKQRDKQMRGEVIVYEARTGNTV